MRLQKDGGLHLECFFPPFSSFLALQQRVNIASLRMLSLDRPAYKTGSWLASEKEAGKQFPALI